jgi:hypothetical protein
MAAGAAWLGESLVEHLRGMLLYGPACPDRLGSFVPREIWRQEQRLDSSAFELLLLTALLSQPSTLSIQTDDPDPATSPEPGQAHPSSKSGTYPLGPPSMFHVPTLRSSVAGQAFYGAPSLATLRSVYRPLSCRALPSYAYLTSPSVRSIPHAESVHFPGHISSPRVPKPRDDWGSKSHGPARSTDRQPPYNHGPPRRPGSRARPVPGQAHPVQGNTFAA